MQITIIAVPRLFGSNLDFRTSREISLNMLFSTSLRVKVSAQSYGQGWTPKFITLKSESRKK